ncbi:nucleotidyltransferase [Mycoplasma enhydrae]|uniref:nucleotidyltransferase n=1 Tax=Mycoplasma enhydrae TaxID=2499220 RepID=UPI0021E77379|nr:nucleotidyltransferase [Mycoplasma enhydrae]MCV3753319.1 nucleotidyltransferase [Mycoplasma enhydrae]
MLKIGLIAEFNPFHNGHIYLINKIKEMYPNSKIIVALSSNYTQRGEIACQSYLKRKKIAKQYGVSKVLKLDFETSTQAAHIFAKGAIDRLNQSGIDLLVFGASDTSNINVYINAANKLKENLEFYNTKAKEIMKTGRSFIYSCYEALKFIIPEKDIPQDILGFEYTKYIINNNLKIKLNCFKRTVSHSSENTSLNYASGTKLRQMIKDKEDISKYSPVKITKLKTIESTYPRFQKIVRKKTPQQLAKIKLVTEGMENLFKKNINASTYDEFVDRCTSKRYTKSRIKRVYLYVLKSIKR